MDIKFVVMNIVKQIIFFVINVYLISYVSDYIDGGKGESFLPATIRKSLFVFRNWTFDYIVTFIELIIRMLTGSVYYKTIKFKFADAIYKPTNSKLIYPDIKFDEVLFFQKNCTKKRALFPTVWIGGYLADLVYVLLPIAFSVVGFRFIAPASFASVVEGLEQWTGFSSGTPNIDFFIGMFNAFCDIVWNRFIVETAKENILVLVAVLVFFFVCLSGHTFNLGKEVTRKNTLYAGVLVSLLLCGLNFAYAIMDYSGYVEISSLINSAGMILLLAMLVGEIIEVTVYSSSRLIGLIKKK